ncbi:hypothetical protein DID80_03135 [Candidatus Marinamargulisbacteria bacterium SCGC AAA071-K20]|nr:hypothetical protein DID80_03135 [Candidatus Marinamargulisbacteria bacterium SCGC AAA071-K20]
MKNFRKESINVLEVRSKDGLKQLKKLIKKSKIVKVLVKKPSEHVVLHVPILVVILFSIFTPLLTATWFFFCVIRGYTLEVYS